MTNSNTSHTQKILLTTLTLLFLTGFSAATQSIADGNVGDLDKALGAQTQDITFTLEDGTDYDGSSGGEATVDIDVTTADSGLTVSSATLDTLSGSSAGDVSSSGNNGVAVTSNTVTLTLDESTLSSSDSTVDVTLTLDDVDASSANTGDTSYDVVSNGDGGGSVSGETESASFTITDASITFNSADLTSNDDVKVSPTASNTGGDVYVEITEADSSTVVGSATLNNGGSQQSITLDSPGEVSDGETLTATMYDSSGGTQLDTATASASQTQSVSGTVFESDGSTPVSSGTVELYEGQQNTDGTADSTVDLSSNSGTYTFNDVAEGDVTIDVTGVDNHEDKSTTFTLSAGEDRTEDFSLDQSATFEAVINSGNTDDSVDQEGTLTVEAKISNVGDVSGTKDVSLEFPDGNTVDTNSDVTISAGSSSTETLTASGSETEVSSGSQTAKVVTEDDTATTSVKVNPVLDKVQVNQDSVEVGQNSALTVDLTGAKDLAGDNFTKSATVNFDTSNFAGTGDSASTSTSPTFDANGDVGGVTVLDSSGTQIQAESEVTVNAGTQLPGSGDSFTANITQVAKTITAESNTTSSDEAVADGDEEVKFTTTVTDYSGDGIEGATVSVDSGQDEGSLSDISSGDTAETNSNGEATFTATSTNSGDYTVQFSTIAGDVTSDTATAHFKPGVTDYLEITTTPSASEAGSESTEFVVTRYDANDNAVTSGSLNVDLSTNSTGENAEFRDSSSGSSTTTVTITGGPSTENFFYYDENAGDHSLTVNASDITADSVTHTVEPAAHTGYSVEPAALTQEAGTPFEVEVKAIDDYSNTVKSIDETLNGYTFTYSNPSNAPNGTSPTYPSDLSFTDGAATGSVTLVAAKDTTLKVEDGQNTPVSGTSSTITVESAAADSVSVNSEPSDSEAGSSISGTPTAKVTDEFGNAVEGVNVSVAEASGYEFDAGTTTVSTDGSGLAEFSNLQINTADTGYQLNFSIDSSADNVIDSPSTQLVQSSEFEVSPASASDVVNLSINQDFVGVVTNQGLMEISGTVVDEFGNTLQTSQGLDVHIRGTTFNKTGNGDFTAFIVPSNIGATETGSADVNVTLDGQSDVLASGEVNLVHEAFYLEEGFNLRSVPQPASLDLEGVDSVTAWNPSEGSYEEPSVGEGEMLENVSDLHRGMYFEAANSYARVGYTFETDAEKLSPGEVEMVNGWHLVGSNFDISETSDNSDVSTGGERSLDTDLQGLQNIGLDDGLTAYPEDLSASISGSKAVSGFAAYWVNVENPEYRNRAILTPNYIPGDRTSFRGLS
ncbi:beta strand repeat-containing protein [Candidatus Nanohalobium constans]|uniref:AIDA autotransporter-like protein ShdA n=1 Tax=Candidatus Nanohalobium constans TaxID=2565781 RepID=A0A5Q0UJ50_9ARCH|nr:Ig-like domain-containing protein [Candidatus Nanohalobium constans]QGA80859.1 AIDA autotransporter-like protein ShdA [Candidatus Nanohalobium constans]